MERAEFAIKQWNDELKTVECKVVDLSHKMFDMFYATFINIKGEEETNLIVLNDLIPKNEAANKTIATIMGKLKE